MQSQNVKLAYSVKEAASISGIGVTKLYQEIKAGRLKARKFGKRTLVTSEAISEWISCLPAMNGGE